MDNWGWRNTNVALVIISFLERDVASSLFSVIIQLKGILESKKFPGSQTLFWLRYHDDSRIPCSCDHAHPILQAHVHIMEAYHKKNTQARCPPNNQAKLCKTWLHTMWKIQAWKTQKLSYCQGETYFRLIHHEMLKKILMQTHTSVLVSERNFLWDRNKYR